MVSGTLCIMIGAVIGNGFVYLGSLTSDSEATYT